MHRPLSSMTLTTVFVGVLLLGTAGLSQDKSVKPGINKGFQDPNVATFVDRFEGESREIFKFRHQIVQALGIEPGMEIADVGAGTGFFSRLISRRMGAEGTVYAVDIAQNFVDHINTIAQKEGTGNIKASLCSERSVNLPEASIDLAFICDTYHHFEYPYDTMASLHKALRSGGRVMIVDFERVVGISREWTLGHVRCGKGTVTDEMADSGFDLVEEIDLGMKEQWVRMYRKRAH